MFVRFLSSTTVAPVESTLQPRSSASAHDCRSGAERNSASHEICSPFCNSNATRFFADFPINRFMGPLTSSRPVAASQRAFLAFGRPVLVSVQTVIFFVNHADLALVQP